MSCNKMHWFVRLHLNVHAEDMIRKTLRCTVRHNYYPQDSVFDVFSSTKVVEQIVGTFCLMIKVSSEPSSVKGMMEFYMKLV